MSFKSFVRASIGATILIGACQPVGEKRGADISGDDFVDRSGPDTLAASRPAIVDGDSQAVADFLSRRGLTLGRVVAANAALYALIVSRPPETDLLLSVIRVRDGVVHPVGKVLSVGQYYPTSATWIALDGREKNALVYTDDYPAEGWVGTMVFRVQGDSLGLVYREPDDTCHPAELRDLDGDGRYELLAYVADPAGGDCGNECYLDLREHGRMIPSWVEVHAWNGDRWQKTERPVGEFYRGLAERYGRTATWVESSAGATCRAMTGIATPSVFRALADRARRAVD